MELRVGMRVQVVKVGATFNPMGSDTTYKLHGLCGVVREIDNSDPDNEFNVMVEFPGIDKLCPCGPYELKVIKLENHKIGAFYS